jgi:hypothetical protein
VQGCHSGAPNLSRCRASVIYGKAPLDCNWINPSFAPPDNRTHPAPGDSRLAYCRPDYSAVSPTTGLTKYDSFAFGGLFRDRWIIGGYTRPFALVSEVPNWDPATGNPDARFTGVRLPPNLRRPCSPEPRSPSHNHGVHHHSDLRMIACSRLLCDRHCACGRAMHTDEKIMALLEHTRALRKDVRRVPTSNPGG